MIEQQYYVFDITMFYQLIQERISANLDQRYDAVDVISKWVICYPHGEMELSFEAWEYEVDKERWLECLNLCKQYLDPSLQQFSLFTKMYQPHIFTQGPYTYLRLLGNPIAF